MPFKECPVEICAANMMGGGECVSIFLCTFYLNLKKSLKMLNIFPETHPFYYFFLSCCHEVINFSTWHWSGLKIYRGFTLVALNRWHNARYKSCWPEGSDSGFPEEVGRALVQWEHRRDISNSRRELSWMTKEMSWPSWSFICSPCWMPPSLQRCSTC